MSLLLGVALPACTSTTSTTGNQAAAPQPARAAHAPGTAPAAPAQPDVVQHASTPLLQQPLTSFGATVHDGWLYVLGGYHGEPHAYSRDGQSGALARMRLDNGHAWEALPGVEPLQSVALVAHDDSIVRVGGMRASNRAGEPEALRSVTESARYRPDTGSWEPLPDLPEGRSSHDAAVLDGVLYVVGGWRLTGERGQSAWHDSALALDLSASEPTWTELPVPFRRRALAVAAAAGHLVAIGGMGPDRKVSDQVDIYDPEAGAWRRGPAFPGSGFGVSAAGVGDAVYASGRDGTVYKLAIPGDTWEPVADLALPRFFHRLVRGSDQEILAVGGILGMDPRARVRPIEAIALDQEASAPRVLHWTLSAPGRARNRQGVFLREHTLYLFGGNNSLGQHDFEPENFLAEGFRLHLGSLTWSPMAPYPAQRQTMQTALIDGGARGISVGGFGHDGEVARTHAESFVYDFAEDAWTPRPESLPVPRSQFGLAHRNDTLWVFGGLDYDPRREGDDFRHLEPVLSAPALEPGTSFQDSGVSLPRARRAFGGALLGDHYYLVGGMQDNFQLVDTCDVYDFEAGEWSTIQCPRRTRLSPQLVAMGGKLYLAGGSSRGEDGKLQADRSIEVFDPATGAWSVMVDELPIETRHMRMFAYGKQLLIYTAHTSSGEVHLLLVDVGAARDL